MFYVFQCEDLDSQSAPCVTKMDERFRKFVEQVFVALENGCTVPLHVTYETGDPTDCRIDLNHYKSTTVSGQVQAPVAAKSSPSGEASLLDDVKKITVTLPAADHAVLKTAWERSRGEHPSLTFEAFMRQVMSTVLSTVRLLTP